MILGRSIVLYVTAIDLILLVLISLGLVHVTGDQEAQIVLAVTAVLNLIAANNVTSTATTAVTPRSPADRHESTLAQLQKHGL